MKKITTAGEAIRVVKSGDTVMIGGFLTGGVPNSLVSALTEASGLSGLTVISNDTGIAGSPFHALMQSGKVSMVYASYIGANPETGRLFITGEARVELVPQGTLAERIRAGGAGLGGILTPTGVGTVVEEGKQKLSIEGRDYLLELPLKGQVALIRAHVADKAGNLIINGSSRNFNLVMATAADYVIVEVDQIVETGEIDPNLVTVPGIFVNAIVIREEQA